MKHKSFPFFVPLFATALVTVVVLGCSNDECPNRNSDLFYLDNCDSPHQSSSRETEIIKECRENNITDTTYLRQHVLGTWQLIGAGSFWGASTSTPVEYSYQSIKFDADSVSLLYLSRSGEIDSVLHFA